MVIKIEYEDATVVVDNDDIITWTVAVERFIEMLRGCGFYPNNFEFVDGDVHKVDSDEVDNDMFEVNLSEHD